MTVALNLLESAGTYHYTVSIAVDDRMLSMTPKSGKSPVLLVSCKV